MVMIRFLELQVCPSELLKAKIKAKAKGDLKDVANCCNVLGELFQQQGKYEDAISEHEVILLIVVL